MFAIAQILIMWYFSLTDEEKQKNNRQSNRKMAVTFESFTELRWFDVASKMVNWKPYMGPNISFKRDHNKTDDRIVTTPLIELLSVVKLL